jgi:hypothetical protein
MESAGNLLDGGDDEGQIGIFGLAQGRGNTDIDGVDVGERAEIGRGAQAAGAERPGHLRRGHVGNVRLTVVDHLDLVRLHIDAGGRESGIGELDEQWQADIPQADHGGVRSTGAQPIEQFGLMTIHGRPV